FLRPSEPLTVESLRAERARLVRRIDDFGACTDALQIWNKMGLPAGRVTDMTAAELTAAKPA
ncbi:MAG TPA: hypothetical protein PLS03_08835, partial [Terrimicrobiaceae bacterium]|nr:hypothetical protein [Terrimicrobiaceae bacterium]